MSKPFLVAQVTDGQLGVIRERDTWEEAVNVAVAMAKVASSEEPEESIREEFEADSDWANLYGDVVISIVQTEDE
jgi:hypothetical protein